ncbi:MAG: hypothetical protein CSA65_03585 [Proteobacteria bacterium]|nr:MAG: hypothetical protein CSB49_07205 [Pseudomonadota bacterium]PIE19006.1 MAG: hypothetical protein CSA65_03585 [Pseudomonadota bacterium]
MSMSVVGIGKAHVDHLAVVDRYPEPESRVDLAGFSLQWGGTIATALSSLSRLGVETRLVTKLGDDDFGRQILRGCEGLGIDTSPVVVENDRISPYNIILIEHGTHRRTVLSTEGNLEPLDPDAVDLSFLDDAKLLVIDGYHMDVQVRAAERAREQGTVVVLDAGQIIEGMGELMALSDVLIASERYASEVAPRGELEDSLIEISRLGPETVVVKLGAEGSIGLHGEKLVRQPPLRVDVVDTTGAGDVFLGGYCFGLLREAPLERCIQLASAAAGLSVRQLGALGGLPDLEEIEAVA